MKVLIVSKTRMQNAVCVGGLDISTNENLRLLNPSGSNQPLNTKFDVGQIWDIVYELAPVKPPHMEDVIVYQEDYVGRQPDMRDFLLQRVQPWYGEPKQLYDGLLQVRNGSGYIAEQTGIPRASVGFWVPDKALTLSSNDKGKLYYSDGGNRLIFPYVGFADTVQTVPAKSLVRVSLARWWAPQQVGEKRCYVQLSGWYL